MKHLLLALLSFIATSLYAQEEFDDNKEGFDHLPKGTIRKEVACFSNWSESEKNNSLKPGKTTMVKSGDNLTDRIITGIQGTPRKQEYELQRS
jgi:hypothetical protein